MIKIDNLKRAYGDFMAVDDVSFTIDKGEIVGLLGHNGAGKTTIMKMISGYLEPSSGHIEVDEMDIAKQRSAVQQRIGYLPEALPIYPEMSVADYLDYAAKLKGLDGDEAREEIRRAVKATDISVKLLAPIATLSRGYKQRVGVAQAILGNPKLLILDEPTNGLDPTQTQQMRELIKEIAKDATVILSTHIMQEVDALCDRVLIMRAGELAVDAKLETLRQSKNLILHTDLKEKKFLMAQPGIVKAEVINRDEHAHYRLQLAEGMDASGVANTLAKALIENGHALYELKREQRDLESVFREVNEQGPQQSKGNKDKEVRHAA